GDDWSSAPPPPSGPVTPPSTFHNLYTGIIVTIVLTFLVACGGGVVVGIVGAQQASKKRFDTVNRPYDPSDPYGYQSSSRSSSSPFNDPAFGSFMFVICGALLMELVSFIITCILIYKAWDLIQDGRPQTTPGKAVGFLFIPFFNLYWIFIAFRGLAEDLN